MGKTTSLPSPLFSPSHSPSHQLKVCAERKKKKDTFPPFHPYRTQKPKKNILEWFRFPKLKTKKMSIAEMRKEDVENTMMTYNRVRKGGPKDKRIRKVELMGEHTAKPLHYVKITQSAHLPLVDVRIIMDECERRVGDVGDAYRPIIEETKQEREFTIVGFYKRDHALICAQKMAGWSWSVIHLSYHISLYIYVVFVFIFDHLT